MTGPRNRVCVLGSFMMDLSVRAPRRPRAGETVVGTSFEMFLGGKGFNQAVAAARSGAPTAMIGCLGDDDFGQRFRTSLGTEGIEDTHVLVHDEVGTGIGLPLVEDSGENSIVIVPRANEMVGVDDIARAEVLIAGSAVLLMQMEMPLDALVAAAEIAHAAGTLTVLNPAPAVHGIERFAGLLDLIVPNHGEALALSGADPDADPAVTAGVLREQAGANVIVTLGDGGVLVLDDDGPMRLSAHRVAPVDTVGAGDAFCGALGAGLADRTPLRSAAAYANAAAAVAVTREGAEPSIPRRAEVFDLLGRSAPATATVG